MNNFYGKAYIRNGLIVGVWPFFNLERFALATFDPMTQKLITCVPLAPEPERLQHLLDTFASDEGLLEAQHDDFIN